MVQRVAAGHFLSDEIGDLQTFDELMMTVDKDLWNLGGYHPSWELGVTWPAARQSR